MKNQYIPTEHQEAMKLNDYLQWIEKDKKQTIWYSKIAQETPSKKWRIIHKTEGFRRGLSDYIILLNGHCIFLELKKKKNYKVSMEQKIFYHAVKNLENDKVHSVISAGADKAIDFIERFLK